MSYLIGDPSNPYRGRKGSQGILLDEKGRTVDFANLVRRQQQSMDPFDQVISAEYYPFIERKPFPEVSSIRDFFSDNVSVEEGLIKLESTGDLEYIETRSYGKYLPGLFAVAGLTYQIDKDSNGDIPEDAYVRVGYFAGEVGEEDGFGVLLEDGEWHTFVINKGVYQYKQARSDWLDKLDGSDDDSNPSGKEVDINNAILRLPFLCGVGHVGFAFVNFDRYKGDSLILADRNELPENETLVRYTDLPIRAEAKNCTLRIGGRHFGVFGGYFPTYRVTTSISDEATFNSDDYETLFSFRKKTGDAWRGMTVNITSLRLFVDSSIFWKVVIDADPSALYGRIKSLSYDEIEVTITGDDTIQGTE